MRYLNISVGSPRDCFKFKNDRLNYNGVSHPKSHSSRAEKRCRNRFYTYKMYMMRHVPLKMTEFTDCYSALKVNVSTKDHGFNPLNPDDALKHHFASLKNDLISSNLVVLEQQIS